MVMWYWSVDNLIWQVSVDHNIMPNIKKVHCKPRLHVSVNLLFGVWLPFCATPPSSSCVRTHGFPFVSCMAMGLHLAALWAAELRYKSLLGCKGLRWFPSKRTHHRFAMKLGMLMLQDKEILQTYKRGGHRACFHTTMLTNTLIKVTFVISARNKISVIIFQSDVLYHTEFDFLWLFIHIRPRKNGFKYLALLIKIFIL